MKRRKLNKTPSPRAPNKTGCADIAVGREDGSLELFDVDAATGRPQLVFRTALGEAVVSIASGRVTGAGAAPELVVHTFSGRLALFSLDPAALALGAAAAAAVGGGNAAAPAVGSGAFASLASSFKEVRGAGAGAGDAQGQQGQQGQQQQQQRLMAALHARVARETAEVAELGRRVEAERSKAAARPGGGGGTALSISHSLRLQLPVTGEAQGGGNGSGGGNGGGGGGERYVLAIESAAPLFAVGLACSRELELLDDAPGGPQPLPRQYTCRRGAVPLPPGRCVWRRRRRRRH